MMRAQLDDVAARGEPVAILIAAEWPIYGRFGYGMAVEQAEYRVDSQLVRFLDHEWAGTVELVDPAGLRAAAPEPFDRHRAVTPGAIGRNGPWWDVWCDVAVRPGDKVPDGRVRVLHRDPAGVVDGYAVYDMKDGWREGRPGGSLALQQLVAATDGAYRDLWRYLCDVDITIRVTAESRSVDEPLPFLLADGRAVRQTVRSDHVWVRLVDVPAALAARRYSTPGSVVFEVDDPFLGRGGRFRLDGGPEGAACVPSTESPDLTLPVASLGAAYLGGTSFLTLGAAGLVDEEHAGALETANQMFAIRPAPWCTSNF
jgi:predicted acetyltransferase